jgi:hypothetical protein
MSRATSSYARSTEVYRALRTALGPWFKEHGWRRRAGSELGWERGTPESGIRIWFRVNAWGSGPTGGNSFYGCVETGTHTIRQRDISYCLMEDERDALRKIQNVINARRPSTEELEQWMGEDSEIGQHTRDMYRQFDPGEKPYRPGDLVTFGYYSLEDVNAHAAFLAQHVPLVIQRFKEQQC